MRNKLTITISIIIILSSISFCKQDVQLYSVTASSLIVRSEPNIKSKKITQISKDSIVTLIETTSKVETIDKKTAPWVKIKTKDGIIGYVFSGYLTANIKYDKSNIYNSLIGIIYRDENKLPIKFDKARGGALDKCDENYGYNYFIKGDDIIVTLEKIHKINNIVHYKILDILVFDARKFFISRYSCKIDDKYDCSLLFVLNDIKINYKSDEIFKPVKAFKINKSKNKLEEIPTDNIKCIVGQF